MRAKLHKYSGDTRDRQMIHVYIALISICFAYCLYFISQELHFTIPWWLDAPSVFGFYFIFYGFYNRTLWKDKLVRRIFSVRTPNWNGEYSCILKSSFDNFTSSSDVVIKIQQTWDSLNVTVRSSTSSSTSLSGCFTINDAIYPLLTYEYVNSPNNDAVDTLSMHRGMCNLWFENGQLKGEFFNGRGRNTFGTILIN